MILDAERAWIRIAAPPWEGWRRWSDVRLNEIALRLQPEELFAPEGSIPIWRRRE
jgi:hypothetical protein